MESSLLSVYLFCTYRIDIRNMHWRRRRLPQIIFTKRSLPCGGRNSSRSNIITRSIKFSATLAERYLPITLQFFNNSLEPTNGKLRDVLVGKLAVSLTRIPLRIRSSTIQLLQLLSRPGIARSPQSISPQNNRKRLVCNLNCLH